MFHFTELEKLFFRSNFKQVTLKTKGIVIYHGKSNDGNNDYYEQKDKLTYSGLKMLQTIITEDFFLSGFTYFTDIHNSQYNRGSGRLSF